MRVARTRFSKRRSKRKTEFPIVAVVQKKRKPLIKSGSQEDRHNVFKGKGENVKKSNFQSQSSSLTSLPKVQRKSRATIDYKNVILLRSLITAEGKILPRRINKLTAKQQRHIQKAIKSARIMGLIPFINKSRPFS